MYGSATHKLAVAVTQAGGFGEQRTHLRVYSIDVFQASSGADLIFQSTPHRDPHCHQSLNLLEEAWKQVTIMSCQSAWDSSQPNAYLQSSSEMSYR